MASKGSDKSAVMTLGIWVLWYGFSASYNVYNAYMRVFPFPYTVGMLQLVAGLFYALPLWVLGLRKFPDVSVKEVVVHLGPVAILNTVGHMAAVFAMLQPGGGSFTHVIKASEPVVSVTLGLIINGAVPKPFTALSLVPIVYGVAYASTLGNLSPESMARELKTKAAFFAMTSNVAFALRSVVRKNMKAEIKAKLDSNQDHALTTLLSCVVLLPVVLIKEDVGEMMSAFGVLVEPLQNKFLFDSFVCGMSFYLYNEFQNLVLSDLGPVPTAVGNTLKRVVIFVGLYLFTAGETFPVPKIVGCAIAISGCLVYAICNSKKI
jgi:solute carrier family 35 protein E1